MPSVYLEQGGRLRCQAVRGYWQIYDGMPAVGRRRSAARSAPGAAAVVEDVADAPRLPARRRRPCAPRSACRCASAARVVGVLNAESPTPLGADARGRGRALRRAARRARLEELGGARRRLARAAARAHRGRGWPRSRTPRTSCARRVAAALELSGFESAHARARRRPRRAATPTTPRARSRSRFAELASEELGRDRAPGSTTARRCYTVGDAAGAGFAGHEPLRRAGAGVADRRCRWRPAGERARASSCSPTAPTTALAPRHVELLELLAVQAAGGLRMAAAVLELRERAARDPLTGLGHHATFHAALPRRAAGARGRPLRAADRRRRRLQGRSTTRRGHAAGDDVLRAMAGLLRAGGARRAAARSGSAATSSRCSSSATARRGAERSAGSCARRRATGSARRCPSASRSPTPGETGEPLVARADAALYEVKRQGATASSSPADLATAPVLVRAGGFGELRLGREAAGSGAWRGRVSG